MLLRFRMENSRSFRSEGELSLIRSRLKGPSVAVQRVPQLSGTEALPAALIYGANASGKSNLLMSIKFFRDSVLLSHRKANPDGGVSRVAFATSDQEELGSSFEADFIADGIRYTFGFSCNDDLFNEEWLYSYPEGKKRIMFERTDQHVEFGGKFTGPKKQLVEFMRPNSLFISTATQNDHPELSKIVSTIGSWCFFFKKSVSDMTLNVEFSGRDVRKRVVRFLDFIGTGVVDVRSESVELPENIKDFGKDLISLFKKNFGDEAVRSREENVEPMNRIELGHRGAGDEVFFLKLARESSGTRRILLLLDKVFQALDNGEVLVVDELDASLHTLACEEIIKLFQNPATNPNGAQIIVTTHDTNLLNSPQVRRDQIWFCERSNEGSSELYSLAELRTRQSDNVERGYLEGRYGAIPYAGDSALLFGRAQ